MAMSFTVVTMNGRIVQETQNGITKNVLSDSLGNVIGLADSDGTITDTFSYWPYGELRSRTGTTSTNFLFVGALGYFVDVLNKLTYIRARHYRPELTRWQTVDPLWPRELPYSYCRHAPSTQVDFLGLSSCVDDCSKFKDPCVWAAGISGIGVFRGGPFSGQRKGGFVICCKGKCTPCVSTEFDEGTPIYECLKEHEENHCKRQKCGDIMGEAEKCFPDCNADECEATSAEIYCLYKALTKCKTSDCSQSLRERMVNVCKYANYFCPNASTGLEGWNGGASRICQSYGKPVY